MDEKRKFFSEVRQLIRSLKQLKPEDMDPGEPSPGFYDATKCIMGIANILIEEGFKDFKYVTKKKDSVLTVNVVKNFEDARVCVSYVVRYAQGRPAYELSMQPYYNGRKVNSLPKAVQAEFGVLESRIESFLEKQIVIGN